MEREDKIVVLMSVIDENLARIFLLNTPLKDAVAKTVDLKDLQWKMQRFEAYFVLWKERTGREQKNSEEKKAAFARLAKKAAFSKILCDYYLEWLAPEDQRPLRIPVKEFNSKSVTALAKYYRHILNTIIKAGGKYEPNSK